MATVILADLIRDHRLLWVYCNECGHERDLASRVDTIPSDYPVPEVGKRIN